MPKQIARAVLFFMLLTAGAPAFPQTAATSPDWTIERLMSGFAAIKRATAQFTEDHYIGLLTKPLHSSGELLYIAPDRLEKNTTVPKPQSMAIDGDKLTVRDANGRTRTLRLSAYPEIGAFVESVRATLSGDVSGLQRYYRVTLTGNMENWQLTLTPVDPKVQKVIKTIAIHGSNFDLSTVEMLQADGDRSVMTVTMQ